MNCKNKSPTQNYDRKELKHHFLEVKIFNITKIIKNSQVILVSDGLLIDGKRTWAAIMTDVRGVELSRG
jgi:hypothetical protein